jgi:hypothetical protein
MATGKIRTKKEGETAGEFSRKVGEGAASVKAYGKNGGNSCAYCGRGGERGGEDKEAYAPVTFWTFLKLYLYGFTTLLLAYVLAVVIRALLKLTVFIVDQPVEFFNNKVVVLVIVGAMAGFWGLKLIGDLLETYAVLSIGVFKRVRDHIRNKRRERVTS